MENNLGNYIVYKIRVDNLVLNGSDTIEVKYEHDNVVEVNICQMIYEGYRYTFFKIMLDDSVKDHKSSQGISQEVIEDILNRLAFNNFSIVGDPDISEIRTNNETISSSFLEAEITVRSGNTQLEELKKSIESTEEYNNDYYKMYRNAIKNTDIVAKYMFLYNIILQINGDKQGEVDKFIIKKLGKRDSLYQCRPDRPDMKETVFTKLRNEVGHIRYGSSPDTTRKEMEKYIEKLSTLTKAAIIEKV